ncbi:hypothetical protein AB0O07_17390 [Streptomyces sp. NPDC093085]
MRPDDAARAARIARALRAVRTALVVSATLAAYSVAGWLLAEHFTR